MILLKKFEDYFLTKAVKAIGGQETMSIQLDITNACNLRCTHCYHENHKNTGAIDLNGWLEVLDQYKAMLDELKMKPNILLCGGEPTISPYLYSVLKRANELWENPKFVILTNGVKLNDKLLEMLSQYEVEFQISIDGPDAKRHDAVRGEGNFDKAIRGAKLAKKYGIKTNILGILSKNTAQWIPEFFEMAKEHGLDSMNFTRFIPQGYGEELQKSGEDDSLYGTDLRDALISILNTSRKTGVKTATSSPLFHLIDPTLGHNGRMGFQGIVVDYKGNMKVSSRANYTVGNVLKDGLKNLFFNHPVMKDFRKGNIKGCGDCMYYSRCGGDRNISFALTGSFLEKDQGCWIAPVALQKGRIA